MNNESILIVENVSKTINDRLLFESVNIELHKGDICCLQGKNGSGKTVFIDCILGFQPVNNGRIFIKGREIYDRVHTRRNSGIVSIDHQSHLYLLTPEEYFHLTIDLYNLDRCETVQYYKELAQRLDINDYMNEQIKYQSFGTKKKIQLIGSLLPKPDLLVCDEIFEGLDQEAIEEVIQIFITRSKNNQVTFFTTHQEIKKLNIPTKLFLLEDKSISLIGEFQ